VRAATRQDRTRLAFSSTVSEGGLPEFNTAGQRKPFDVFLGYSK